MKAEYNRIVIIIVLTRPIRSPMIPKIKPPIAQPTMKMVVAIPAASATLPAADGSPGSRADEFRHRRLTGQVEELLVHRVEQPAQRGDDEHEPLVSRQLLPPGALMPKVRLDGGSSLVEVHRQDLRFGGVPSGRPIREAPAPGV